jgi:hypothetical protein
MNWMFRRASLSPASIFLDTMPLTPKRVGDSARWTVDVRLQRRRSKSVCTELLTTSFYTLPRAPTLQLPNVVCACHMHHCLSLRQMQDPYTDMLLPNERILLPHNEINMWRLYNACCTGFTCPCELQMSTLHIYRPGQMHCQPSPHPLAVFTTYTPFPPPLISDAASCAAIHRDGSFNPSHVWTQFLTSMLQDESAFLCRPQYADLEPTVANCINRVGEHRGLMTFAQPPS